MTPEPFDFDFDVSDDCKVIRESPLALYVFLPHPFNQRVWIPKSALSPESEVRRHLPFGTPGPGSRGMLIVKKWFAMKAGLHPNSEHYLPRRKQKTA